jgi:hypothetical protein
VIKRAKETIADAEQELANCPPQSRQVLRKMLKELKADLDVLERLNRRDLQ